ncbi:polysaccharide pyruvyl transferase family protein, partial [Pseudomonas otitidis]
EDLERLGIREKAAKLLNSFSALSVRDDNSSEIVQVLTGKTPQLHIDPVLLYPFSEILLEKPEPFDYILVYAYNNRLRAEEAEQIQAFAKRHGKRLLSVNNFQDFCEEKRVASPLKVLSYFRFADYV